MGSVQVSVLQGPAHANAVERGMVRRYEAAVEDVVVRQRAAQDAVKGEHLDGHPEVLWTR